MQRILRWLLYATIPIAIALQFIHGHLVAEFVFACAAVLPLAAWIGVSTEQLAHRMGSTFGALFNATFGNFAEMPKPVIASVNGIAAGAGCNLALSCDYRIASDAAKLGETFVKIGIHPDWGGTWFLPRLVGPSRAFELSTTGRMVDAAEALAIGMVDRVVPLADLPEQTLTLARVIAAGPPQAIADIKRALAASRTNSLSAQVEMESEHQLRAFLSRDAAEGMAAFFEKRTPIFDVR